MEELAKIITAATKAWGVERYEIIDRSSEDAKKAAACVSFIVCEYHPHLLKSLVMLTNKDRKAVQSDMIMIAQMLRNDKRVYTAIKRMIRTLALPFRQYIKKYEPPKRVVSCTMQLFGFDYTEEEKLRYERILKEAPTFWRRMTEISYPLPLGKNKDSITNNI